MEKYWKLFYEYHFISCQYQPILPSFLLYDQYIKLGLEMSLSHGMAHVLKVTKMLHHVFSLKMYFKTFFFTFSHQFYLRFIFMSKFQIFMKHNKKWRMSSFVFVQCCLNCNVPFPPLWVFNMYRGWNRPGLRSAQIKIFQNINLMYFLPKQKFYVVFHLRHDI